MKPVIKQCVACASAYDFFPFKQYPGKSTKRCPECQLRRKEGGTGNAGMRGSGHNTRQQHKRVRPKQM